MVKEVARMSTVEIDNRYQRQADLLSNQGWDQEKLENATVAVIGSGSLAHYATLTLAAFGFGTIEPVIQGKVTTDVLKNHQNSEPYDFSDGFLYFETSPFKAKAEALETIIHKINPMVKIHGLNLDMARREHWHFLDHVDLIIEATNTNLSAGFSP